MNLCYDFIVCGCGAYQCVFPVELSCFINICRAFVNNVWYIKVLSPEEVQKLGKQVVESLNLTGGQNLSSSSCEASNLVSGISSVGSLEYWRIWRGTLYINFCMKLQIIYSKHDTYLDIYTRACAHSWTAVYVIALKTKKK